MLSRFIEEYCCYSVTQLCPTLCDPMDWSRSGLSVPHCLPGFAQLHVHWIGDAIQSSHPLTSSSPSALNLCHQGHFWWVSCLHQVTKILELQCHSTIKVMKFCHTLQCGWTLKTLYEIKKAWCEKMNTVWLLLCEIHRIGKFRDRK